MSEQQQPSTTHTTSPIPASAKAGLEKALSHRPDREDLVNRNILPDGNVAPALAAAKKELERSRLEDQLENFIKNRPDAEKLVKEGVLQEDEVPPSS